MSAPVIDYKRFIETFFFMKNKQGELVPFIFNDVQNLWYETLEAEHPDMQGIRESILKSRQFGLSSSITAIFTCDFIMSELGEIPLIYSDVYSYKDEETQAHIARFNLFLNSWLVKVQGGTIENMH